MQPCLPIIFEAEVQYLGAGYWDGASEAVITSADTVTSDGDRYLGGASRTVYGLPVSRLRNILSCTYVSLSCLTHSHDPRDAVVMPDGCRPAVPGHRLSTAIAKLVADTDIITKSYIGTREP